MSQQPKRPVPSEPNRSFGDNVRMGIAGAIVLLLGLFVIVNTDKTKIDFLVDDVEMPLFVILVATAILGAIAGQLIAYLVRRERQKKD
jgi:uncharacterized integral membrane protein